MNAILIVAALAGVIESAREIPVADDVDVLVVGGTAASVSAATAAARDGARVMLATGAAFLGEDLAGTLDLACDPSPDATPLERRLRASTSGEMHYAYSQKAGFRYLGGWQFQNDSQEKFSTAKPPRDPWDTVLYLEPAEVTCTLDRPAEIASVDVTVIENDDPGADASCAVDHRGCLRPGDRGPLTGRVTLTWLDGPRAGETIELRRLPRTEALDGAAVREGEPGAVGGPPAGRPKIRQRVSHFAAPCRLTFGRARVTVAGAEGAACHLLSRIRFKLAHPDGEATVPTPLKVKQVFDRELIASGVRFLTVSPATDLLVDASGAVAGAVFANRNGRQAVVAKSVVDGTRLATLAGRIALPRADGAPASSRVACSLAVAFPPAARGLSPEIRRTEFELPAGDGSYRAFAALEGEARARVWDARVVDVADCLKFAAAPRAADRPFLRAIPDFGPLAARIAKGRAAGRAAVAEARTRTPPTGVRVRTAEFDGENQPGDAAGDVRELLGGLRPSCARTHRTVPSGARALPVFGDFDVVVAGGGTSGAAAGVAAARRGARTLVLEYLHVLGGVGTDGMITGYYDGNHCGFTEEFKASVKALPAKNPALRRAEVWRRMCRDAGAEVWYGAFAAGAVVRGGRVTGVVVVTPFGRGVVRAKSVVDGTGNADVAAAAGAETQFISASELALQSAGQAPHRFFSGLNSDFGHVNDTDAVDLWLFGLRARAGSPTAWDLQQLPDSRERRRIVSDRMVMGWDVVRKRRYADVVVIASSRQDSHGYFIDDYGAVAERDGLKKPFVNVPLRAMLPRGLAGLAVIGLGKGVSRDVVPFTRMQADVMNEGYAVGLCAADAARSAQGDYRRIDMRGVQRELVKKGNLPGEVLDWADAPDAPTDAELAAAVATLPEGFAGAGVVMAARPRAVPFLRDAYAGATTERARQVYAEMLGLCGDATGAETLSGLFTGRLRYESQPESRSYGNGLTGIGLALALGRTKAACAIGPIRQMLDRLTADSTVEAVRRATLAAEAHGSAKLAPALAAALKRPGLGGWSRREVAELAPLGGYFISEESNRCIKELALARALRACGDSVGLAKRTLEAYAADPRGVFAEHAARILGSGPAHGDVRRAQERVEGLRSARATEVAN